MPAMPRPCSLLFLTGGAAAATLLMRSGPGAPGFVAARSQRPMLPLLFGIAVVVAPQPGFEAISKYGDDGRFQEFLILHFSADKRFCPRTPDTHCIDLPDWNHLWSLP
jgi:hypothetical protein